MTRNNATIRNLIFGGLLMGGACGEQEMEEARNANGGETYWDYYGGDNESSETEDSVPEDDADGAGGNTNSLTLPFPEGEYWQLTRGYLTGSHTDYGYDWIDDSYALDFALAGCDSWRKPITPIRSGTVEIVGYDEDGYGHYVLIDHGDGFKSRYAHFDETGVSVDEVVTTSDTIGLTGNTGYVSGVACADHPGTHLHVAYYEEGEGVAPEPMSGHTDFTAGCWYGHDGWIDCGGDDISDNTDDEDNAEDEDDEDNTDDDEGLSSGESEEEDDESGESTGGEEEEEEDEEEDDDEGSSSGESEEEDDESGESTGGEEEEEEDEEEDDGCDWTVPADVGTIQDAINVAVTGEVVCVEAGSYSEDLVFTGQDITVQSVDGPDSTHVYGVSTGSGDAVVSFENGETLATVFEGFTLHGAGSRGINIDSSSPTLRNVLLECDTARYGVFFASFVSSPSARIENMRVEDCSSYGVYMPGGSGVEIYNLIVTGSGTVGMQVNGGSDVTVVNSVFYDNNVMGIRVMDADATVENSIFVGHSDYGLSLEEPSYTVISRYNTFNNNGASVSSDVSSGTGDTEEDPDFSDASSADFTLQASSSCIDAGNPSSSMNDTDGTRNDKGAYGGPYSESW